MKFIRCHYHDAKTDKFLYAKKEEPTDNDYCHACGENLLELEDDMCHGFCGPTIGHLWIKRIDKED